MQITSDKKLYVQYGAGNEAIPGWENYDSSPTLRIQKIPILGSLVRGQLNCVFDDDIKFGDIVTGLPLGSETVDGMFCSHVLEHLTLADFATALRNTFFYLKRGGVFRMVVPDLRYYIANYQRAKLSSESDRVTNAAHEFCKDTSLGVEETRSTIRRRLVDAFRGSGHRWMWDYDALKQALIDHGFVEVRRFKKGVCDDRMFLLPEREHQFGDLETPYGLALECRKPLL